MLIGRVEEDVCLFFCVFVVAIVTGGDDGVDEALLRQVLGRVVKSSSVVEFNKMILAKA